MGFAFETPLFVFFLVRLGIVKSSTLSRFRKHVLIGILIAVAIITPNGDPFSLLIVSLPLFLIFEISVFVARVCNKKEIEHK